MSEAKPFIKATLDGCFFVYFTTYDLVSRGSNECWGTYNSNTGNGYGGGYKNPCIRSGTIKALGDLPTSWYNYVLTSAGTISEDTDSSHFASNTEKATESICPKGWTLPTKAQINANRDVASFSPVLGGGYDNGTMYSESTLGSWWGSEANGGAKRYALGYDGSSLYTNYGGRRYSGYYVRCVQKLADS